MTFETESRVNITLRTQFNLTILLRGFPGGSDGKESTCNEGDPGLIPGLGRSPGGGHGNPFKYSCQENPHKQKSLQGYSPWGHKETQLSNWVATEYTGSVFTLAEITESNVSSFTSPYRRFVSKNKIHSVMWIKFILICNVNKIHNVSKVYLSAYVLQTNKQNLPYFYSGGGQTSIKIQRVSILALPYDICGEGNGTPLQYSCLENPMDRGAWRAAVYRVAQSQTWLKWLSSSYIVVHTLNAPNLSILLLLDVGAVYSSLLLRMSFTCICFMSWMGVNEA